LKGGATPLLYDAMKADGALDTAAAAALPSLTATPQTPTTAQATAANAFLKQNWDAAVA